MQQITPTAHSVPIYSPSAESLAPSYHRQHLSSFDPQDAEAQQFLAQTTERVQQLQLELEDLKSQRTEAKSKGGKNVSNEHPEAKEEVHTRFWRACGVDPHASTEDRIDALQPPLSDGTAYVEDDKGNKTWQPDWNSRVDRGPNKSFINYLTEVTMDDERRRRESNGKKLPDESWKEKIIHVIATNYFSHIARQWRLRQTNEGRDKQDKNKQTSRRRCRRTTVTAERREAAAFFDARFKVEGSIALLDTDFASSRHSCDEDELSESIRERRRDQDAGQGSWMIVSRSWRRKLYVKFLMVLDHLYRTKEHVTETTVTDEAGRPKKKKKVNKRPNKLSTRHGTFYAPPTTINPRAPSSNKAKPIHPIRGMIRKTWLSEQGHPLVLREDPDWWFKWEQQLQDGDLSDRARAFLDELGSDTSGVSQPEDRECSVIGQEHSI
ncbi:hypothetical protein NEOLEDRAFT_1152809 [Neolentinus lepideus HHB14362 ss-1]|uniref:Uncharacterized protein n=1 Tax=Neolentinus lepideus HHB14362 ss-1 TaxID=1314782 RepID=A0A165M9T9_9AGAM|nr:hypothetical protein NEOLEDRAFT_1152809 [Neolentinus lepideus HHB14362 ss-1]